MTHRGGGTASQLSLPALVATALVRHDVPDADEAEIAAAAGYVDDCLAAMPDITRAGVAVASGVAYVALSALGRSPYRRQTEQMRSSTAVRLAAVRLPVLSEFGRLTRGLGLVGVYERRAHEQA